MSGTGIPAWEWIFLAITLLPCLIIMGLIMVGRAIGARPEKRHRINGVDIELWVRERHFPSRAEAIIVPTAPDLKLAVGIAKWVRDATADRAQADADRAAPLEPGEAFVCAGGRYRFGRTILACVMDDQKRTTPEWISTAIRHAMHLAVENDARSIVVPDMTEDLLRQPNWITDEQRRETCRPIARAIMDGIVEGSHDVEEVKLWVWRAVNADIYEAELDRAAAEARPKPRAVPAAT